MLSPDEIDAIALAIRREDAEADQGEPVLMGEPYEVREARPVTGSTPPPSVGDVLFAAASCGWPRVVLGDGRTLDGEKAWRAAVVAAAADGRFGLWKALRER